MWRKVETVRLVFVCPNCQKKHFRYITDKPSILGAYWTACNICDKFGVICDLVDIEVEDKEKQ